MMVINWPLVFCVVSGVLNMLPTVIEAVVSAGRGRIKSRLLTAAGLLSMLTANACSAAFTEGWSSPEALVIFFIGTFVMLAVDSVFAGVYVKTASRAVGIPFALCSAAAMAISCITEPHPAVIAAAVICAAVRIVDFCLREG